MLKHATSHGLSMLFCSIAAAFMIETSKPIWPELTLLLNKASFWLQDYIGNKISIEYLNIIIAASVLAFIWGIVFKRSFWKE